MIIPGDKSASHLLTKGFILLCLSFALSSCERSDKDAEAVLETLQIFDITFSSFKVKAVVHELGGESLIEHGFCWSPSPEPTLENSSFNELGKRYVAGEYFGTVTNLERESTYYVRAYVINATGTFYGNELSIFTERDLSLPILTTTQVSTATEYTAVVGGRFKDDGGSEIDSFGICWDTEPNPTIEGMHKILGEGRKDFATTLKGLELKTRYYVRAFASNSTGLAYGNEVVFWTNDESVTDIDGNVYGALVIGEQVWMASNIRATRYADGSDIEIEADDALWDSLDFDDRAYCYYNNIPGDGRLFGALYTWSAAVNEQRDSPLPEVVQGICPSGWHVPSDEDWKELETYLGMSSEVSDSTGWRGAPAGGRLKSPGRDFWLPPNTGATNEFRFSALPAGERAPTGQFFNRSYGTFFWTSTSFDEETAWARALGYFVPTIYRGHADSKDFGFSVRCIKDN